MILLHGSLQVLGHMHREFKTLGCFRVLARAYYAGHALRGRQGEGEREGGRSFHVRLGEVVGRMF